MSDSSPTLSQHLRIGWRKHKKAAIAASLAGAAGVGFGKSLKDRKTDQNWERGKARAKNALITGTAGAFAGSLLDSGRSGHRGARLGGAIGAIAGMLNDPKKRSKTADTIATGGDWTFSQRRKAEGGVTAFAKQPEKKKSRWKRAALITAGAGAGAVLGMRTLPRLIRRGRPLAANESTTGKILYTNEGLSTPGEAVRWGGKSLRRRLDKAAHKGSKLAAAAAKVDDYLGIPQRHYGIGVGGGRVVEKTKAHGNRVASDRDFARGNRIHVDSDVSPKTPEAAKAMNDRYEKAVSGSKRGDLCLIGNNCEHHARFIGGQGRKSWQSRAIVGGGVGGAAVGGTAAAVATGERRKVDGGRRKEHQFAARKPKERDRWEKARDASLAAAGLGVAGGAGYLALRSGRAIGKLTDKVDDVVRKTVDKADIPATTANVRNASAIYADAGRAWNAGKNLAHDAVKGVKAAPGAYREGVEKAAPATGWKRRLARAVHRPLRAVGLSDPRRVHRFESGAGNLLASQIQNPKERAKWRDVADIGAKGATAYGAWKLIKHMDRAGENLEATRRAIEKVSGQIGDASAAVKDRAENPIGVKRGIRRWAGRAWNATKGAAAKVFLHHDARPVTAFKQGKAARQQGIKQGSLFRLDALMPRCLDAFTSFARGDYTDEHGRHVSAADVFYGKRQAYEKKWNPDLRGGRGGFEVDLNSPKDAALLDAAGALHSKAKTMARWGGRATGFVRDATDAATGKPRRKDASGRTQKREWEKPWFSRHAKELLATAALVGGGVVLKRSPKAQALWGKAKAKGEEYAGKAGGMVDRGLEKLMGPRAPKNTAGLKVVPKPEVKPSRAFVLDPPKGKRTIKEVDQAVKKKTGRNANRPLKTGQYYASPPPIDPYPQHAYPEMTRRMSAIQGCLVQLDEFIPSKDAVESLREMRRYNRWIKPEKIGTPEQQERQSRMMLPTSRIQQAAAAGWLPWGAKARARRQANRDLDWVNEGLMSDYNRGFSIPCAFRLPPSALTAFDDAADMAGWDVRDPRGRSARVFAPGAGKRDRREKYWHEKVDNERKLWAAASLLAGGTGVAAARKLLPRTVEKVTEKVVPVVLPKAESFTLWGSKALSRAPRAARKKGLSLVRSGPVQKGLRLDGKEYIAASDRRPAMQFSRLPVSLSPRLHLFAKAEGGRRKAEGSESPTLTPLKKGIAIGTGATAALTGAGLLAGTRRGRDLVRAGLNWVDRKALKSEAEAAGQATMNARASVRNGMKTETTSVRRRPQRRGVFGTIHEEPMEKSPSLRKAVKGVFRRAKRRLVDKVNRIGTEEMSAHEGTKSQRLTQFASRSEVLKEVVGNLGRTASRFVQDVSGGSVKSAQKELAKRKGHLADFRNLVDRIESGEAAPRRWSRMPGMPDTLEKARINRMRRASGQVLQATQRQDRARNLLKISGAAAGSGAVAGYAVGRSRHQGTEASRQQVQKRRLA